MRQSVSLYIAASLMSIASIMHTSVALPAAAAGKAGLGNTLDVTVGTVTAEVKGLLKGVAKPQSIGSKAQGQKGGYVAGSNIGDSVGSTLKGIL
ncbi:uncharacterized protein ATC70_010594 [Mucor velutinosus]|uniref:Uncharacterized protein n=1 Tax=Mucor velutinosus TaxID=708070 RepID=A0AAN7DEG6_9FUNG|nr:hypothetical protein ATC70_010594 [Mucor velutinosus]